MLKEINKTDVMSVILLNGQELMCKVVSQDDSSITVEQPLQLVMGQEGAQFQQYSMTGVTDGKVSFNKNMVLTVVKTQDDIAKNYRQVTSGIVLA